MTDSHNTDLFQLWVDGAVSKLPLYRRLCEAAASDPEVADRLLASPDPAQRLPNLLLAAVHDVVLAADPDPDVAAVSQWYPSVPIVSDISWVREAAPELQAGDQGVRPVGEGADDPWPYFRRLALEHHGVAEHLATRQTQTNEIGRCATVLAALNRIALESGRPIGLVEVGASAGLNLFPDSYSYRYEPESDQLGPSRQPIEVGTGDGIVLTCRMRGEGRPNLSGAPPRIVSRIGIDLHPIDVTDARQARWLIACQWPDEPDRVARAVAAIDLARANFDGLGPVVQRGDAVTQAASLVEQVDPNAVAVVLSTWVQSYLSADQQQALAESLDVIGQQRDLSFVYAEQPALIPGLAAMGLVPPQPPGRIEGPVETGVSALVSVDWRDGERVAHRLANQHPHGRWMEWLPDPR